VITIISSRCPVLLFYHYLSMSVCMLVVMQKTMITVTRALAQSEGLNELRSNAVAQGAFILPGAGDNVWSLRHNETKYLLRHVPKALIPYQLPHLPGAAATGARMRKGGAGLETWDDLTEFMAASKAVSTSSCSGSDCSVTQPGPVAVALTQSVADPISAAVFKAVSAAAKQLRAAKQLQAAGQQAVPES